MFGCPKKHPDALLAKTMVQKVVRRFQYIAMIEMENWDCQEEEPSSL